MDLILFGSLNSLLCHMGSAKATDLNDYLEIYFNIFAKDFTSHVKLENTWGDKRS